MTTFKACIYDNDWGQFIDTDLDPIPSIPPKKQNTFGLKTIQECLEEDLQKEEDNKQMEEDIKIKKKKLQFKEKNDDYSNIPDTIIYFRTY